MRRILLALVSIAAGTSWGQLTTEQKVQDFQNLTSLYAKQYAPYHWKVQAFGYDLFQIGPWLDKVRKSAGDIEFYEIMAQYVASLNDAHSIYFNPSDFEADLRFRTDIYEGKVLIDAIDRTALPTSRFPFQIGDEVVMVDNRTPDDLIRDFSRFFSDANPLSTRRDAAGLIPVRIQAFDPRAEELGDNATVVIRRQNGNLETYTIKWVKFGTPLTQNGPVPTPRGAGRLATRAEANPDDSGDPEPEFMHPLRYYQYLRVPMKKAVLNFDALPPIFALPQGFVQRLGRRSTDFFFTGTYQSGGKTIGFIRIADFDLFGDFSNINAGRAAFDTEIAFMEKNTDGLVVDIMRNPGGFACYAEDLMSRLATRPFHDLNFEFRPTISDVQAFAQDVQAAIDFGAPSYIVDTLKNYQANINLAYREGGMTGPLPLCGLSSNRDPNKDRNGNLAVYDKPILMLTDEFSVSSADFMAAMFQDAQRGKIFGMRTMGGGGTVAGFNTGFYSEGFAYVTQTLGERLNPIVTPEYPTAPYIENIGVRPDIQRDYMTMSNLLNRGSDFVNGFTTAIVGMIGQ